MRQSYLSLLTAVVGLTAWGHTGADVLKPIKSISGGRKSCLNWKDTSKYRPLEEDRKHRIERGVPLPGDLL